MHSGAVMILALLEADAGGLRVGAQPGLLSNLGRKNREGAGDVAQCKMSWIQSPMQKKKQLTNQMNKQISKDTSDIRLGHNSTEIIPLFYLQIGPQGLKH